MGSLPTVHNPFEDLDRGVAREGGRLAGQPIGRGQQTADEWAGVGSQTGKYSPIGAGIEAHNQIGVPLDKKIGSMGSSDVSDSNPAGQDYNALTSKWYGLADQQVGQQLQNNLGTLGQQSNQGLQSSLGALAQRGGVSSGSAERMAQQSANNQSSLAAQLAQQGAGLKTDLYQKGVMGLELPIMQGKDAMAAQANANALAAESNGMWGNLLQAGGTVVGGMYGGPAGAAAGGMAGKYVGSAVDKNNKKKN